MPPPLSPELRLSFPCMALPGRDGGCGCMESTGSCLGRQGETCRAGWGASSAVGPAPLVLLWSALVHRGLLWSWSSEPWDFLAASSRHPHWPGRTLLGGNPAVGPSWAEEGSGKGWVLLVLLVFPCTRDTGLATEDLVLVPGWVG